tara:strand:- start:13013 stop:13348 length:336 start_codon:yes stop_codon:yes gene_type:complete
MTTETPTKSRVSFTPEEQTDYQIRVFKTDILEKDIDKTKYPQGTTLVIYSIGDEIINDLVLSQKSVHIFDAYYDKLRTLSGKLLHLNNWYGTISPKMWDENPKPKQKKKRK